MVRERAELDTEREDTVCPQAIWGDTPDPGPLLLSPDKLHYQKQVQENMHEFAEQIDTLMFTDSD